MTGGGTGPAAAAPATPPEVVLRLVRERAAARSARDFATADDLRGRIEAAGWRVEDVSGGIRPEGYVLTPAATFPAADRIDDLRRPPGPAPARRATVGLLVDGWPEDVRRCSGALLEHHPPGGVVSAHDRGDVDGAGMVLHELAAAHPGRVEAWHVAGRGVRPGWGLSRTALLRLDPAPAHVVMDLSVVLDGDAVTPLLDMLDADPSVVAAGWQGVLVDTDDEWRSVRPAGPGEVDALLGYLFAVRTPAAMTAPPHPKAGFYRNADLEWSLALREQGGRLVVPAVDLPCHAERHRGFHDSDPDVRDRESRRTYQRMLRRFRGRTGLLAPRP
ncbi:MAG: hypothetical protein ACHQE5_01015 [Actinomycetes bacterium]